MSSQYYLYGTILAGWNPGTVLASRTRAFHFMHEPFVRYNSVTNDSVFVRLRERLRIVSWLQVVRTFTLTEQSQELDENRAYAVT